MRKLISALAVMSGAVMAWAVPASAHVHAFTPLGCLTTDNANSGATVGWNMANDAAAPLNGPTKVIPFNASGKTLSGGQGAENAC
jgi:hypothetical protein